MEGNLKTSLSGIDLSVFFYYLVNFIYAAFKPKNVQKSECSKNNCFLQTIPQCSEVHTKTL